MACGCEEADDLHNKPVVRDGLHREELKESLTESTAKARLFFCYIADSVTFWAHDSILPGNLLDKLRSAFLQ